MSTTTEAERQGSGPKERPAPALAGGGTGEGALAVHQSQLSRARAMRRGSTTAELKLWQKLHHHRNGGRKFRRQVPLGTYIADCHRASVRLLIELDSVSQLDSPGDEVRDEWRRWRGLRVRRLSNLNVTTNVEGVMVAIGEAAGAPPPPEPVLRGEGEGFIRSAHLVPHV